MATDGSFSKSLPNSGDIGDKPYPAATMLQPFRIRSLRPRGEDGVVRMKREEYDDLLKRQPRAALSYIDESDGEVILVGSSLELDQRLQEPVESTSHSRSGTTAGPNTTGNRQMHIFEVEREQPVVQAWQTLDQRTADEGRKAKELFFGRNTTAPDSNQPKPEVRFGQVSPPRGALKAAPPVPPKNRHTSRWASYSNLPGSFNHEPVLVTTDDTSEADETAPLITLASVVKDDLPIKDDVSVKDNFEVPLVPRSAFDIMAEAAAAPVRSSTLQIPATQKQKAEHQPLIDMFFTEQKNAELEAEPEVAATATTAAATETQKDQPKEWQPLLDLFHGQLAELVAPSASTSKSPANEGTAEPASHKGPFAQKSGEILSQSIQSLLNGVGLLAATFKKTNLELQQQIALAQQDFPNNMEKALKASVAAIESLKSMIHAANNNNNIINTPLATDSAAPQQTQQATQSSNLHELSARDVDMKMRQYRFKLQKHFLSSKTHPTHDIVLMLNEIFIELETKYERLPAETLLSSKVHKVMKAINRMPQVPGDEEFSFKQRAASLAETWMEIIQLYRLKADYANSAKRPATSSEGVQTIESAIGERNLSTQAPAANKNANEKEEEEKYTAEQAEHMHRVEKATEDMRQQLLGMGLLPPAERPLGAFYTRADVLEAYIQKFNELKNQLEGASSSNAPQPKVMLGHGADHLAKDDFSYGLERVEVSRTQTPTGTLKRPEDTNTSELASTKMQTDTQTKTALTTQDSATAPVVPEKAPRKAVSFDQLAEASPRARWSLPSHPGQRQARMSAGTTTHNAPLYTVPQGASFPTAPAPPAPMEPRPLRHRQSWHPTSAAAAYPFSFSPQEVMARYPPISELHRDPRLPVYQQPVPRALPYGMPPPPVPPVNPYSIPPPGFRPLNPPNSSTQPAGQAYQRTSAIKEEIQRRQAERREHAAEHRRTQRRAQREEPRWIAEQQQNAEKEKAIRTCTEQLVKMGFAHGKSDAVATAVLGNLEMALDVLNEDSAAWEAKAKQEERRETGRGREYVPGSWDDELYG